MLHQFTATDIVRRFTRLVLGMNIVLDPKSTSCTELEILLNTHPLWLVSAEQDNVHYLIDLSRKIYHIEKSGNFPGSYCIGSNKVTDLRLPTGCTIIPLTPDKYKLLDGSYNSYIL